MDIQFKEFCIEIEEKIIYNIYTIKKIYTIKVYKSKHALLKGFCHHK